MVEIETKCVFFLRWDELDHWPFNSSSYRYRETKKTVRKWQWQCQQIPENSFVIQLEVEILLLYVVSYWLLYAGFFPTCYHSIVFIWNWCVFRRNIWCSKWNEQNKWFVQYLLMHATDKRKLFQLFDWRKLMQSIEVEGGHLTNKWLKWTLRFWWEWLNGSV